MTARGPSPARRRDARLRARAEHLATVESITKREALRRLRIDRADVARAARGEITDRAMLRGTEIPPEVRKAQHDTRGAVRS